MGTTKKTWYEEQYGDDVTLLEAINLSVKEYKNKTTKKK